MYTTIVIHIVILIVGEHVVELNNINAIISGGQQIVV